MAESGPKGSSQKPFPQRKPSLTGSPEFVSGWREVPESGNTWVPHSEWSLVSIAYRAKPAPGAASTLAVRRAGAPEARVGEGSARACAASASTSERPKGHARNPGFCCGPLGPPSNACQVQDCARSTCEPCQGTELVRFSALRPEAVRGLGVLPGDHDYLFPETFQEEQPQTLLFDDLDSLEEYWHFGRCPFIGICETPV
ncbi:unnamed protein product [Rangifer tarandus platyrhynchus]|uniref:Uncharacterized protein n=1 Tax=Rangifer tarandus platyrhynchus TaxID=3082113 RepID=A0ABN8ZY81_RANTA|nr:unnamed protein product [Rangifer tarandus platyrhynchus]